VKIICIACGREIKGASDLAIHRVTHWAFMGPGQTDLRLFNRYPPLPEPKNAPEPYSEEGPDVWAFASTWEEARDIVAMALGPEPPADSEDEWPDLLLEEREPDGVYEHE